MNPIVGAIQAGLIGNNNIPKPRFILEVPRFRIHDVANEPDVALELDKIGFGIISYTWGRFQNEATYEDSPNAPKFDLLNQPGPNQIWWYIPKMKPGQFSMEDVRGIVEKLNMKYVWWDWACIPQSWDSGNRVDPKRSPRIIGSLADEHKKVAKDEVAKQFYIYTLAKKGFNWFRDIEWAAPLSVQGTAIQKCIEKGQRFKPWPDLKTAVTEARIAVESFQRMKLEDNWLSSMWTFQEGILLNTDDVIDPRDDRLLDTRNLSQFARLVDKKGRVYKSDTCFRDEATLLDLTGRATLLACDIAGAVIQAIQTNQPQIASELQALLGRLYETGLVGVAADSPLDLLEAAKARGVTSMNEVDYCINAILGALRVVLPDGTPDGTANADDLDLRRRTLLSTLVDRNGWKMILLSKPTRGSWDPLFPQDITSGTGDWVSSLLQRIWQFTSLGIFITSQVGRPPTSLLLPKPSPAPGVGHVIPDTLSLTQPVPYTDNVLLLGALQVRDHISLPPLRHALAVDAALGLGGGTSNTDAMVIGPEDANAILDGTPPPYGFFCYGVVVNKNNKKNQPVPPSQPWTSCRFYASEAEPAPKTPGIFPVKTAHCLVQKIDFARAFRADTFGAGGVGVVLLPIEDVSVFKGTVVVNKSGGGGGRDGGLERVVVVRCVVLTDFRMGLQKGGSGGAMVGGGIFLGIGDFTFNGSPGAVTVQSVLGDGWMIYMY
ncbi:hypothetical protein C8A00DRAFT_17916 [Chaetomidium leptoderma]|uniref:Heterokaryon incompatibility domain-containing protein n=1 Tax=Chaetomidium leptoderma TaxID=669021 RepID=A0AAN6ZUC8_9PEZI|nr:hypothetical protein C8A00DRAFT_17916 [Chaetomidium leptoderma]